MRAIAQRIDRHLSLLPPQRAAKVEYLLLGLLECIEHEDEEAEQDDMVHQPSRRAAGKEALNRIAKRGGIAGIVDPVSWQREQRADRPLAGRDQ